MADKILNTVDIRLIGCGDESTFIYADDTESNPTNGKYAIDQFKAKEQLHFINDNNKECYVPFHAIESVYVKSEITSVPSRPNPHGCGDKETITITFDTTCGNNPPNSGTPEPIVARKGDVITLPDIHTTYDRALWSTKCDDSCSARNFDENAEVIIGESLPFEDVTLHYAYPCL